MIMYRRNTVVEMFSAFAQFSGDRFESWVADRQLVRQMQKMTKQTSQSELHTEVFWSLFWYYQWQRKENRYALMHLCAYLQEPCYWAAANVIQRFACVPYTLADGFQIAIPHIEQILHHYDPGQGSSLKTYARSAFGNLIRNQLCQQKIITICSDWGLLRKLSKTQLNCALQIAGITQRELNIQIWQCFKSMGDLEENRMSRRMVRPLTQPTMEQLTLIARRYNQQQTSFSPIAPEATPEMVLESLQQSVKAVRAQLNPTMISLNQARYDDGHELINDLRATETPMATLLSTETHNEQQRKMKALGAVLAHGIDRLPPSMQTLLFLYYQQNLTQKEIASQLNIKQYKVSRQLTRVRRQLLSSLAQWSQDTFHLCLEFAELDNISDIIHQWLQNYYSTNPLGMTR